MIITASHSNGNELTIADGLAVGRFASFTTDDPTGMLLIDCRTEHTSTVVALTKEQREALRDFLIANP